MANNIDAGYNLVTAAADSDMSIFTSGNTAIVYGLSGGNFTSFVPGRSINRLTSIQAGKGYMVVSKAARDLNNVFGAAGSPPVFSSIFNS